MNIFGYLTQPTLCISLKIARLAQLVERKTFNLVVVGSSPTVGTRVVGLKQLGIIYKILIRRQNRVSLKWIAIG
jgi:hypothetical protein